MNSLSQTPAETITITVKYRVNSLYKKRKRKRERERERERKLLLEMRTKIIKFKSDFLVQNSNQNRPKGRGIERERKMKSEKGNNFASKVSQMDFRYGNASSPSRSYKNEASCLTILLHSYGKFLCARPSERKECVEK